MFYQRWRWFRAQIKDVLSKFSRKFQHIDIQLSVLAYLLCTDVKQTHIPYKEQQLIKTNILMSFFLTLLFSIGPTSFDIPYSDRIFLKLRFHFCFLIYGFKESCFPPLYFCPNTMLTYQLLKFYLFTVFNKVISQRKDHQHFRVICIKLFVTLYKIYSTTSRKQLIQSIIFSFL